MFVKSKEIRAKAETGCCLRFDPKPWKDKTLKWKDKLFVKVRIKSFFHIPLNIAGVMEKTTELIDKADALSPSFVGLFDENSLWGADVYLSVTKKVPGAEMAKISGTFMTKVFEGPYMNAGKWAKEMEDYVKAKGKKIKKMYFYYTTCPRCAKYYGKTYTVILAQI
jgi:hypothetical protein